MKKIAVVLFNLGGPDSKKSIRPFLFNFFMDRNIVQAPLPLRFLLAQYISVKRSRKEAGKSYELLGGSSPLLQNSKAQAAALEDVLNRDKSLKYKVFIAMRYWHPMAAETVRQVQEWGADEIVLLPLYPQFSTTTTGSSLGVWRREAERQNLKIPSRMVCCYPFNEGFIQASKENILMALEQAKADGHENVRLLFSAHGLPEKIIKGGDPYQWQCEEGAVKISEALGREVDWQVCYQSRVGPLKWIDPSTEEALVKAAKDGKAVLIYPHAFTQEHVETLVEIEMEYREKAHELGISGFYRVPTVATHPAFIEGLANLVQNAGKGVAADGGRQICPPQFGRCCMVMEEKEYAKLAA